MLANVSLTLMQQIGALILQLVLVVLLTRALGAEDFGRYAVAVLLPGVLARVLSLGLPAANVYALGRGGRLRVALGWNLRMGGALLAVGGALGAGLILGAGAVVFPGVPPALLWVAIGGYPATLAYGLGTSLLRGKQDFRRYNLAMLSNPAAALLATLLLVWGAGLGGGGAAAAWVIGQTCGLAAAAWFVRGHWRAEPAGSTPGERPSLAYGLKTHLGNILTFLNYRIDIFLVNFLLGPAGAGIYTAAVRVAEQLWLTSNAVVVVLLPRLTELDRAEHVRRRLTPLVARWVTIGGLSRAAGFSASGAA